jgi:gluconate 2-dehydrogenase gamma chain
MPGASTQGYQSLDAPAVRYRAGLKALADYVKATYSGKSSPELAPADQDKVLAGLESGSITLKDVKAADFFRTAAAEHAGRLLCRPDLWRQPGHGRLELVGFPGARYEYSDWVERHNEVYPLPPVSITGRSDWTVRQ